MTNLAKHAKIPAMSYSTSIFLITAHSSYYPQGGASDWVSAHDDRSEAEEAFRGLVRHEGYAAFVQLYTDQDAETHWRTLDTKSFGL